MKKYLLLIGLILLAVGLIAVYQFQVRSITQANTVRLEAVEQGIPSEEDILLQKETVMIEHFESLEGIFATYFDTHGSYPKDLLLLPVSEQQLSALKEAGVSYETYNEFQAYKLSIPVSDHFAPLAREDGGENDSLYEIIVKE